MKPLFQLGAGVVMALTLGLIADDAGKNLVVEATPGRVSGAVQHRPSSVSQPAKPVSFTVAIENISSTDGQKASNGTRWPFAISPGLWVVHRDGAKPLFSSGKKAPLNGLESQAEEGDPSKLLESVTKSSQVISAGVFNTPRGSTSPGPAGPGQSYTFEFKASPGDRLSLSTMFGQSNDLFYAPADNGIALFDGNGKPIRGEITSSLTLWDAGTEVNQEPGVGPDQAPRQKHPNSGKSEDRVINAVDDGFTYPPTSSVLRMTITPTESLSSRSNM